MQGKFSPRRWGSPGAERFGWPAGWTRPACRKKRRRRSQSTSRAADEGSPEPGPELARVEAALFLSREPLTTRKLAELAGVADGTRARTLVGQLAERLRRRGAAMQPVEIAGGWQLLTQPRLADWLGRLLGGPEDARLSPAALETLAAVAYRQPATRAEIEAIRGVQCGELLRLLMERDLLRIVGRADELGRPFLYGTTRNFLQVFGLRRLEDLPPIDQTRTTAGRSDAGASLIATGAIECA